MTLDVIEYEWNLGRMTRTEDVGYNGWWDRSVPWTIWSLRPTVRPSGNAFLRSLPETLVGWTPEVGLGCDLYESVEGGEWGTVESCDWVLLRYEWSGGAEARL